MNDIGLVTVGENLEFLYPVKNDRNARREMKRRRIVVEEVRDIKEKPLDTVTLKLHPERRRGRFLITGKDLDKGEQRKFYLDEMVLWPAAPTGKLRLAFYDPTNPEDSVEFFGPTFTDAVSDKALMRIAIAHFNRIIRKKRLRFCIAAFPLEQAG